MAFVYFDICHWKKSLRNLYSVTLIYIFNFKCLKYVKLVRLRKINNEQIQQDTFKHLRSNGVSYVFLHCDHELHFDFKCLKYVKFVRFRILPEDKVMKNSSVHIEKIDIEWRKYVLFLRDLDLSFQDKMFKILISLKR